MMDRDRAAARSMYSTSSSSRVSAQSVTSGSADWSRAAYFGPTASTILFLRTEVSAPAAHWISPSLRPIRFGSRSRTTRPRASHWLSPFFWSKAPASQAFLNRPWVSVRETFRRSMPLAGPRVEEDQDLGDGIPVPEGHHGLEDGVEVVLVAGDDPHVEAGLAHQPRQERLEPFGGDLVDEIRLLADGEDGRRPAVLRRGRGWGQYRERWTRRRG